MVDFGLSKWDFLTNKQLMSGTTFYIAPEVLKSSKTSKSDIWSVGVIMFTLLSGLLPFVEDGKQNVFQKAIKGDYSMDSGVWEEVSSEAKSLIRKMINIDLDKRFTAEECLAHEWFTIKHSPTTNEKFSTNVAKNFKLIRSQTIIQNVAKSLVKKVQIKDIKGMRDEFEKIADDDNTVDFINFKRILLQFESELTTEQADLIIKEILSSQNATGRINYFDFIGELKNLHNYNTDTQMWMTFSKYINQDTGHLPYSELKAALEEIDSPRRRDDLKELCMILKIDQDEEIDFVKFKKLVKHKSKSKF